MANKTLLERLEADAKRHRAPQTEILPAWVNTVEKSSFAAPTIEPEIKKRKEKPKKSDKKAKKKK
jgi:hypothetical protein